MKKCIWYETGNRHGGVSFRCDARPFVLWVTNQHIDQPGKWIGSCSGLFDNIPLGLTGGIELAQDAQEMCMNIAIMKLQKAINMLRDIPTVKA